MLGDAGTIDRFGLAFKRNKNNCKNTKKQEPHRRAYLSKNGGLGKKKPGEWAKSRKRIGQKEQQD